MATVNFLPVIDVKAYGAKGDGATDDTVAIQNALNAVATASGILSFPSGTYVVTGQLSLTGATGVKLLGAKNATLSFNLPSGRGIFVSGCANTTVEGLRIAGNVLFAIFIYQSQFITVLDCDISGAAQVAGGAGISIYQTNDVWIERNFLHGNGAGNMGQTHDIDTNPAILDYERIFIKNNRVESTQVTVNVAMYNTANSQVIGNYVSGAIEDDANLADKIGGYGIMFYVTPGGTSGSNVISGNTVQNTQGMGIYLQGQPFSTVAGNVLSNVTSTLANASLLVCGITVIGTGAPEASITVTGNTVRNSGGQAGIGVSASNTTVSGNTVIASTLAGILVDVGNNVTISGNSIVDTGSQGIVNTIALSGLNVSGNTVSNPSVSWGMYLQNINHSSVVGNTVIGAGLDGIAILASNHLLISDNIVENAGQAVNNTYSGIHIQNTTDSTLIGNISRNSGGTGAKYGIQEEAASNRNTFERNNCVPNVTAALSLVGTHDILVGNEYNVLEFGAKGDGVADDTNAIQATITAAIAGGGSLLIPAGTYNVTSTLNVTSTTSFFRIRGGGRRTTLIEFNPSMPAALFSFQASPGNATLSGITVSGLGIKGLGVNQKIAFQCHDVSDFLFEDIDITTWTGGTSIGWQFYGREQTTIRRVTCFADRPIHVRLNPNETNGGMDHFHLEDTYFAVLVTTEAVIEVDDNVVNSDWVIDGTNAWVGGKYGIHWNQTTELNEVIAINMYVSNVRWEQLGDTTGFFVYFNAPANSTLDNVVVDKCYCPSSGLRIRNAYPVTLRNFVMTDPTKTILDVLGCLLVNIQSVLPGTSTLTAPDMVEVWRDPTNAVPQQCPNNGVLSKTNAQPLYNAAQEKGVFKTKYKGTVNNGVSFQIKELQVGTYTLARLRISATSADGTITEGGEVVLAQNGGAPAAGLVYSSTNFVIGNVGGKMSFLVNGANDMEILNNRGVNLNYLIDVDFW